MWKANYGLTTSLKNSRRRKFNFSERRTHSLVRELSTDNLHICFGTCQNCVKNNESSATGFRVLIATLLSLECTTFGPIFRELTSKLVNTRINEFLNPKSKRELRMQGKVVDADEMLRPKLKLYVRVFKFLD